MNSETLVTLAIGTLLLTGCSTTPERADAAFGNAERNMIAVQHLPRAAAAPRYDGTGIRGAEAEGAYRALRGEKPAAEPVQIEVKNVSRADR